MAKWCLVALGLLLSAPGARAAPQVVSTDAVFRLEIANIGEFTFLGSGDVTVSGNSVRVPAGLVSLTRTVVIPTTSTTAFSSVTFLGLANGPGTFSRNGVAFQAPAEICPGTANHPNGLACNEGRGIGGVMPMSTLSFQVTVVPRIVVIPAILPLLGQGGSTNVPFSFDFAAWTAGDAFIASVDGTRSFHGDERPLTLVSPVFIEALPGLRFPAVATLSLLDVSLGSGASCSASGEAPSLLLVGVGIGGLVVLRSRTR